MARSDCENDNIYSDDDVETLAEIYDDVYFSQYFEEIPFIYIILHSIIL